MKAVVSVHGRFHGFDLARELDRRGHLARLITTYPRFAVGRFLDGRIDTACAFHLELLRRAQSRLGMNGRFDLAIARSFGRFAASRLVDCDLFVGWSGASLEAIAPARSRGAKIVIERGSSHIRHQAEVLSVAYRDCGLADEAVDMRMIDREEEEYALADAIAVPTRFAAATFVRRGIPADRLIVNPYGVDLARFAAVGREKSPGKKVRILFVGKVGPRKGVPQLVRAFARHAGAAELHLVGPVEKGMEKILADAADKGVSVRGPVPSAAVAREFAAADIFCLPSLEEGLALVILQAMAAGLPVVASPESGAEDVVSPETEGLLAAAGDEAALGEALGRLIADAGLRAGMGAAARRRVEAGFGWSDYGDRAVTAYRGLIA